MHMPSIIYVYDFLSRDVLPYFQLKLSNRVTQGIPLAYRNATHENEGMVVDIIDQWHHFVQ